MRTTIDETRNRFVDFLEQEKLRIGDRIPSERQLTQLLQASRTTLRRLLNELEKQEFIERRNQAGTYIKGKITRLDNKGGLSVASTTPDAMVSVMMPMDNDKRIQKFIHDFLMEHNHLMNIYLPHEDWQDPRLEREFFQSLLTTNLKGLLTYATPIKPLNTDMMQLLEDSGIRLAHMSYFRESLPDQGFFLPDFEGVGRLAAHILVERGCRYALINPGNELATQGAPFMHLVYKGFSEACDYLDLEILDMVLPHTHRDVDSDTARKTCLAIPDKTGIVSRFNTVTLVELRKARGKDLGGIPILYFGYTEEYDANPLLQDVPLLGFSRLKLLQDALSYLLRLDGAEAHKLYRPRFIRPEKLACY